MASGSDGDGSAVASGSDGDGSAVTSGSDGDGSAVASGSDGVGDGGRESFGSGAGAGAPTMPLGSDAAAADSVSGAAATAKSSPYDSQASGSDGGSGAGAWAATSFSGGPARCWKSSGYGSALATGARFFVSDGVLGLGARGEAMRAAAVRCAAARAARSSFSAGDSGGASTRGGARVVHAAAGRRTHSIVSPLEGQNGGGSRGSGRTSTGGRWRTGLASLSTVWLIDRAWHACSLRRTRRSAHVLRASALSRTSRGS